MSRKWTKEQRAAHGEKMRERWKIWKNQPVPVLAEPQQADSLTLSKDNRRQDDGGEARKSTELASRNWQQESRGGLVLSKTDQKFWSLRPGYYDFTKDGQWGRKCRNCHEDFVTRLEHNRFCSPNCRNEWLTRHETRGA